MRKRILLIVGWAFLTASLLSSCATAAFGDLSSTLSRVNRDLRQSANVSYSGPESSKIIGGREVKPTELHAKLAVLLVITRGSRISTCTGVLYSKRVVLTAGHCVDAVSPINVRVFFRTRIDEWPNPGPEYSVAKIKIHEKYDGTPNSFSDLALLSLTKEAPESFEAVEFYDGKDPLKEDSVLLLGYGITSENKSDSLILREISKSFSRDMTLKESFVGISQKSESGGFCRGDSGAPVFVSTQSGRKLYAINSFTIGLEKNRECREASVALLVSHFSNWIKKNAADL